MLLSITLIRMLGLLLDSLCQKAKLPSLPGMLAAVFGVSMDEIIAVEADAKTQISA